MKRNVRTLAVLALFLGVQLTSCKNETKAPAEVNTEHHGHDQPQHSEDDHQMMEETAEEAQISMKDAVVGDEFKTYLELKDALVKSDAELVKKIAQAGVSQFDSAPMKAMAASSDIEEQRKEFVAMTAMMEEKLKGNILSGAVYKQYCPMAFQNQGGYWLSDSKEVLNPYFGDKMLRCGSVKEILE